MSGVEILSSQPIYNTYLPEWCAAFGFLALVILCFIGLALLADEHVSIGLTFVIIGIASFIISMILSFSDNKASIAYFEHKVTIDDSVSMVEFMDKYEILDQEGKIYTIKEKKVEV